MKRTVLLSLFTIFSVITILLCVFIILRNQNSTKNSVGSVEREAIWEHGVKDIAPHDSYVQNKVENVDEEQFEYILKDFDGKIAVYKKNETVPKFIFDVYINSLPKEDQTQLYNGIYAKDDFELSRLIEDYSS